MYIICRMVFIIPLPQLSCVLQKQSFLRKVSVRWLLQALDSKEDKLQGPSLSVEIMIDRQGNKLEPPPSIRYYSRSIETWIVCFWRQDRYKMSRGTTSLFSLIFIYVCHVYVFECSWWGSVNCWSLAQALNSTEKIICVSSESQN